MNGHLTAWQEKQSSHHAVNLVRRVAEAHGGDILFLVSCSEIVRDEDRALYGATLVIHASDLPKGRGWSPHIWQILEGREEIVISLLDAGQFVDQGDIWHQEKCHFPKTALWDEINQLLFDAELRLMDWAVENIGTARPVPQDALVEPSYYPKRTPADGALDPDHSIKQVFDAVRVADPDRFPAFFQLRGKTYTIEFRRIDDE